MRLRARPWVVAVSLVGATALLLSRDVRYFAVPIWWLGLLVLGSIYVGTRKLKAVSDEGSMTVRDASLRMLAYLLPALLIGWALISLLPIVLAFGWVIPMLPYFLLIALFKGMPPHIPLTWMAMTLAVWIPIVLRWDPSLPWSSALISPRLSAFVRRHPWGIGVGVFASLGFAKLRPAYLFWFIDLLTLAALGVAIAHTQRSSRFGVRATSVAILKTAGLFITAVAVSFFVAGAVIAVVSRTMPTDSTAGGMFLGALFLAVWIASSLLIWLISMLVWGFRGTQARQTPESEVEWHPPRRDLDDSSHPNKGSRDLFKYHPDRY